MIIEKWQQQWQYIIYILNIPKNSINFRPNFNNDRTSTTGSAGGLFGGA